MWGGYAAHRLDTFRVYFVTIGFLKTCISFRACLDGDALDLRMGLARGQPRSACRPTRMFL